MRMFWDHHMEPMTAIESGAEIALSCANVDYVTGVDGVSICRGMTCSSKCIAFPKSPSDAGLGWVD
jgi:hypothetical protein